MQLRRRATQPGYERPTRTFRTVADFLAVPPTEIGACLSVFQDACCRRTNGGFVDAALAEVSHRTRAREEFQGSAA